MSLSSRSEEGDPKQHTISTSFNGTILEQNWISCGVMISVSGRFCLLSLPMCLLSPTLSVQAPRLHLESDQYHELFCLCQRFTPLFVIGLQLLHHHNSTVHLSTPSLN